MSEELPPQPSTSAEETKVVYYQDGEETPYMIRIPVPSDKVTLRDFKNALNRPNYKFFFKGFDSDIGEVKEEIHDENAKLPVGENGVIRSWLVAADGSSHSDGSGTKRNLVPGAAKFGMGGGFVDPSSYAAAAAAFDQTVNSTDTESTFSALPRGFPKQGGALNRRMVQPQFQPARPGRRGMGRLDNDSTITSDSDTARMPFESDDDRSRVSTSTDITSVSQQMRSKQRKKRRRFRQPSRASSITSITESSMSLNIITVTLNMDTVNFLGISIVGQSNQRGDGGIFVANIMKGGAVALDGRIEPGDMILQVNETSFENLSNDDAVSVLRDAVQKPGPIRLVVAKCWEPTPKGYFTIPRQEPVRPIDPGAWVMHTNAMRAGACAMPSILEGSEGAPTPTPGFRPASASTLTSQNSGSMGTTSLPETERYATDMNLDINTDMSQIVKAMAKPDSGLDIRDRTWLKITIPNSFLGSDVVDWLLSHVHGFVDRKDARKYAARMLKENYIKHTVNKITFSDQCYYTFGDLCASLGALRLGPDNQPGAPLHIGHAGPSLSKNGDEGTQSDQDTVDPLPPPSYNMAIGALNIGAVGRQPPSMASGYASLPFQYGPESGVFPSQQHMGSLPSSAPTAPIHLINGGMAIPPMAAAEVQSAASGGSAGSSGSEKRAKKASPLSAPPVPPKPPTTNIPVMHTLSLSAAARTIEEVPRDLAGSRQSFRMAMGNPCEFFVDYM